MKIARILIKNYKSIKDLDIKPNFGLNAFIGENNVGKSNMFEAVNWLLGPGYPTFNATTKQDHYLGDENNKILVQLYFEDGYLLELNELKEKYQFSIYQNGTPQKDLSSLREKFCSAYVGTEREIVDYLPSNRWSLLGRILLDVNQRFLEETMENGEAKTEKLKKELDKIRDELLFSVKDINGNEVMKKFVTILQEESARQMNMKPSDLQLNFNLYDPWNFYKTLQILVHEQDIGLTFQASQLGTGAQASITIAILRAYSEIKLGGGNPIFIDEPELFLHPQAQRHFYKILRELSESQDIQIFYTTHSPYFLALEYFDEIFLVKKAKKKGTYVGSAKPEEFLEDWAARYGEDISDSKTKSKKLKELRFHYKNAYEQTADSLSSIEAFFAKKIILVEGESEALILPYFFQRTGFDYIKERTSIVKCGSKNELDRFYRLYVEFGIPCFVIFDGDEDKEDEEDHKKKNNELFKILNEDSMTDFPDGTAKDNYCGFRKDFNHALQEVGFQNVRNDSDPEKSPKGLTLFLRIKNQEDIGVPAWIFEIKDKVLNLPSEVESVLIRQNVENKFQVKHREEEGSDIEKIPF